MADPAANDYHLGDRLVVDGIHIDECQLYGGSVVVGSVVLGGANYVHELDYDNDPGPHNHANVTGYHRSDCPKCAWLRAQQSRVL